MRQMCHSPSILMVWTFTGGPVANLAIDKQGDAKLRLCSKTGSEVVRLV